MDALLHYAWGFVAGFVRALVLPTEEKKRAALEHWRKQWNSGLRQLIQSPAAFLATPHDLLPLKSAVVGRTRGEVASILGPPPATSAQPLPASRRGKWEADTWYYPIDRARRRAIAIIFQDDIAQAVEQVSGPRY